MLSVLLAGQMLLAVVFFVAGIQKLRGGVGKPLELLRVVGLRDTGPLRVAVHIFPFIELLLGCWLLSGWQIFAALFASTSLLCAFSLILAKAITVGYTGACGCFGDNGVVPVNVVHIASNGVLTLIGILLGAYYAQEQFAPSLWNMDHVAMAVITIVMFFGLHSLLAHMHFLWQRSSTERYGQ